jgi:hypothetical protein
LLKILLGTNSNVIPRQLEHLDRSPVFDAGANVDIPLSVLSGVSSSAKILLNIFFNHSVDVFMSAFSISPVMSIPGALLFFNFLSTILSRLPISPHSQFHYLYAPFILLPICLEVPCLEPLKVFLPSFQDISVLGKNIAILISDNAIPILEFCTDILGDFLYRPLLSPSCNLLCFPDQLFDAFPLVIPTYLFHFYIKCKTNTIPILMNQMRISTYKVSEVMLRPKEVGNSNKKCVTLKELSKKRFQTQCNEIEPNPLKDRAMQ